MIHRCRILQPRSPAKQTEREASAQTPVVSLTRMHTGLGVCEPCSASSCPEISKTVSSSLLSRKADILTLPSTTERAPRRWQRFLLLHPLILLIGASPFFRKVPEEPHNHTVKPGDRYVMNFYLSSGVRLPRRQKTPEPFQRQADSP